MKSHSAFGCGRVAVLAMWLGCQYLIPSARADEGSAPPLIEFALGLPGTQAVLSWAGELGARYHVEKSTDLGAAAGGGGGWTRVAFVEATGPMVEWRDPQSVTERCFYRVTQPQAEVFSIQPPVLSSDGGTIVVQGQRLPAGAVLELRDADGNLVGSFPLVEEIGGRWRVDVAGGFTPGDWLTASVVGAGILPTGSTVPLSVTLSGYSVDAPASTPPGAPLAAGQMSGNSIYGRMAPGPDRDCDSSSDDSDSDRGSSASTSILSRAKVFMWVAPSSARRGSPTDDSDLVGAGPIDDSDVGPLGVAINEKGLPGDPNPFAKKETKGSHRILPPSSGLPGEVSFHFDALSLPCPAGPRLAWIMTYRSAAPVSSGHGPQWDFSYNISIEPQPSTAGSSAPRVVVRDGSGRADVFHRQADGTYRCDGLYRQGKFAGDTFTLTFADQGKWVFHPLGSAPNAGKIASITDRNNVSLACDYDASGLLSSVSDVFGRSLSVTWATTGGVSRISSVSDSAGRTVHFTAYASGESGGAKGTLKSISCPQVAGIPPEAAPFVFTYTSGNSDPNLNDNLLSITDGAGRLLEAFTYHSASDARNVEYDRCATHDRHGDGHVTVLKSAPNSSGGYTLYQVDEVGRLTETDCDKLHRVTSIRQFTGVCTPGTPADAATNRPAGKLRASDPDFYESQYSWNPDHALTQITDPDGSQLRFVHEREFRPGGPPTENGNVRSVTLRSATGQTRLVSFEYLPGFGTLESAMPGGPFRGAPVKCGRNSGGEIVGKAGFPTLNMDNILEPTETFRLSSSGNGTIGGVTLNDDADSLINPIAMDKGLRFRSIPASLSIPQDDSDDVASISVAKQTQGVDFGERKAVGRRDMLSDNATSSSVMGVISGSSDVWQAGPIYVLAPPDPRISRIVTGHGHEYRWTYDVHGNPSSYTTPIAGSGATYEHDTLGRCTSLTLADGADSYTTAFTYDAATGMPATVSVDPGNLNLTTQFHYDALGRCVREVDPGGFDTLFEYLPSGRLSRCESPPVGSSRIATTFHYDSAARLVRCDVENRDSTGALHSSNSAYSTFFVYDTRARLVRVADEERPVAVTSELTPDSLGIANFAVRDFTFNPAGEVSRVSTPAACRGATEDLVCDYQYDERGLVYRCIQGGLGAPDAIVDQIDYSHAGLPVRSARLVSGAAVSEMLCDYDGFHRLSSVTDPMGNVVQFSYDSRGGITREVFGELVDEPGSAGNVLLSRTKIEEGGRFNLQLGAIGLEGRLTLPDLSDVCYDIFAGSTPSLASRSLFHQWPNQDDEITEERFVAGSTAPPVVETTTITRSPAGFAKQVSRNGDLLATFTHDSAGRVASSSSAATTTTITRDSRGDTLLCGTTSHFRIGGAPSKTFTVAHQYDSLGRRVQSSDSSGNTVVRAFDSLGRLSRMTTETGMVVTCDYDGGTAVGPYSRRISGDLDGDGSAEIVVSSFSRCGEWKSSTDPSGYVTSATRDALGRISRVDYPEGTFETFSYNSRGLHHWGNRVDGMTCSIDHDLNGRPVSISLENLPAGVAAVADTTYRYDGLGRMVRCDQGTSSVVMAWDSLGDRVGETQNDVTVSSSFNHRGRTGLLTSVQQPYQLRTAENRDSLGRLLSVSLVDATGTLSPPVASFEHLGHHVSRSIAGNGVSTAYTFRGDGEVPVSGDHSFGMKPVRCIVTNGSGAVLSDSSISRDAAQLATSISTRFSATPAGPGRTTSLVRDGMGRVTGWSTSRRDGLGLPPVVENEVSYTLDSRGDRLFVFGGQDPGSYTQSAALPPGDAQRARYTTWPRGSLEWDANRNLTRIPYSDITHTMQYDALGRLVSIKNEATGSPIAEYSYDGLNRLLTLTVHGGSVPHFTRFIYDGSVCVQELGGDGVADLTHVVSDGIRHCISTRNGTIYYPHSSNLTYIGPCDASEVITSATGAVVEHRTCDGDGRPIYLSPDGLPSSTGTSVTPIRWTAPECLSVPNTRTCTCGTGYYVSSLGKVVGKVKDLTNPNTKKEYVGHVTLLK